MTIVDHLEVYINAQKGVGFNAFVFGTALFIVALLFHFFAGSQLAAGIKTTMFVLTLVLFAMGIGLRVQQEKILKDQTALFKEVKFEEFLKLETDRMTRVKNNIPIQQSIMVALLAASLIGFLLLKSQTWQGVCLSIGIFILGNIIIEAFSYLSITHYYDKLIN